MDIAQLLKRQEGLVDEMAKGLKARGFDPAMLTRTAAVTEERAVAVRSRIAAIEQDKADHAAWADQQIAALKVELGALGEARKAAAATVAPVLKAAAAATPSELDKAIERPSARKTTARKARPATKTTRARPAPSKAPRT